MLKKTKWLCNPKWKSFKDFVTIAIIFVNPCHFQATTENILKQKKFICFHNSLELFYFFNFIWKERYSSSKN